MTLTKENWIGEKYHENSDQQKVVAELLIEQFHFRPTDSILDVGCGDGKITAYLGKKVFSGKVVGLDPSESMYNFARSKYEKGNVRFTLGKASDVSFQHEFDVITSFSALHWEPNQKKALECFKKALKPGGTLLLAIPGPDLVLRSALKDVCQLNTWATYFEEYQSPGKIWSANEYAELLITTNFMIQKIEVVDRPYMFKDEITYKNFASAMLPHLSQLPKNMHDDFLTKIIQNIKNKGRINQSGGLKFDMKVLEVIAHAPT